MPNQLLFTKMQGVGNDFVVIDGRKDGDLDWSVLALEICDRKTGVGADGLLVIDTMHHVDLMMRMYNPDGTPDVCGNGLRCIARYAVERGLVSGDSLRIGTLAGVRAATVTRDSNGNVESVTVGMGKPKFDPPSIPMLIATDDVRNYPLELDLGLTLSVSSLSTGSTHTVTFVDSLPEDVPFMAISSEVEEHPYFPDRTSLMWTRRESPTRYSIRIWERGVGETFGCGTGACAVAVAAIRNGLAPPGEPITIVSRGGELQITWSFGEPISMTGPAQTVYQGIYRLDPRNPVHPSFD